MPLIAQAAHGLETRPSNLTCLAPAPVSSSVDMTLSRVYPNLNFNNPVAMLQAPNDSSRWYIAERNGRVLRFDNNAVTGNPLTVLDIRDQVVFAVEGGLMGIAFHPDFSRNGQLYLSYTGPGSPFVSYISRFTSSDGGTSFDPGSEQVLIQFDQPSEFHNNGHLSFGPDGYLYIGSGDGGPLQDGSNNGQNTNNLFSAILRIDVDRGSPYAIPNDNPFAAGGGAPEIYAWGLRNPWRFSFDRATGDLWAGDVGERDQEEVNVILRGRNYGWSIMEGDDCFNTSTCNNNGLEAPVETYSHAHGCAITGGYAYRGSALPDLQGTYLYSDFCSGTVWGLTNISGNNFASEVLLESDQQIVSFAEDPNGELYLVSFNGGLYSLRPANDSTTEPGSFPDRLSETGCFDPADPTQPATGVIPYDLIAPLWSDAATKTRFLAIPDRNTIHIDASNDWEFPIGSVLSKSFYIQGRIIETRLLAHHSDGVWRGYSYDWNETQTDATLIPAAEQRSRMVNGQVWRYPTRAQCMQCHTAGAKQVLGPETVQMNRIFTYPSTGISSNQLETFDHIDLFDSPLPAPVHKLPALTAPTDTSRPLSERARSYLHSNCSGCHRKGGSTQLNIDLRYDTPESESGICDKRPSAGNLGIADARIIAPGDASRSILLQRMLATDGKRMPLMGTEIVDTVGTSLIAAWITQGGACGATSVDSGSNDGSSNGDDAGSGGGCALRLVSSPIDPMLPTLVLLTVTYLLRRRF